MIKKLLIILKKKIKKKVVFEYKRFKKKHSLLKKTMENSRKNPKKRRKKDNPTKYIHIGYPKSASTAIQKAYLGKHNQLHHLGCGAKKNNEFWDDHGYVNKEVNVALEVDLRYRTSLSYDSDAVKAIFDKEFEKANQDEHIHAVGVSNENFCFNWHGGIDIAEKAIRLYDIFGKGTQIVIVLRNQKKLIESLYKETIRFGYDGTFEEYLKYLWTYKDRNFFYEFHFNKVIDIYASFFGIENINILFFEDLKSDTNQFLKDFSTAIGIDYYELDFKKEFNKQLSMKELYIKRMMNSKYPHTFGKGKYDVVDNHRYIPFFSNELEETIDTIKIDNKTRKALSALSVQLSKEIETPELVINWENSYGSRIIKSFSESNQELSLVNDGINQKLNKYKYINLG